MTRLCPRCQQRERKRGAPYCQQCGAAKAADWRAANPERWHEIQQEARRRRNAPGARTRQPWTSTDLAQLSGPLSTKALARKLERSPAAVARKRWDLGREARWRQAAR